MQASSSSIPRVPEFGLSFPINQLFNFRQPTQGQPLNTIFFPASRETAFIHAISSAAIAYELTRSCRRIIRECKCVKRRDLNGCGANFEFGQNQTKRFFENFEKGHGARVAVNLHNNKVGREVIVFSADVTCVAPTRVKVTIASGKECCLKKLRSESCDMMR